MFFCVLKDFGPITRVANNSREKFLIIHAPNMGFLCYLDSDKILLYGSWLENRRLIYMLLCEDFVNILCLNQSEV